MNRIESAVIVKWPQGWVAHLRFSDSAHDVDFSATSRFMIHRLIDRYVEQVGG